MNSNIINILQTIQHTKTFHILFFCHITSIITQESDTNNKKNNTQCYTKNYHSVTIEQAASDPLITKSHIMPLVLT